MSRHLDQLRQQIQHSFGESFLSPQWGAPVLMTGPATTVFSAEIDLPDNL